jgi:hypothetical protein
MIRRVRRIIPIEAGTSAEPTERDRRAEDAHGFEAAGLVAVFSGLGIAFGIVLEILQDAMPRPRSRSPVSGEV